MRWTRFLRSALTLGRTPGPSASPDIDTSPTAVGSEGVVCLGCGTTNPTGAKFCLNCGQEVGEPGKGSGASQLQKYIPKELLAARPRII